MNILNIFISCYLIQICIDLNANINILIFYWLRSLSYNPADFPNDIYFITFNFHSYSNMDFIMDSILLVIEDELLTSPFLSCQGLGLTRSSTSASTGGPSSSLTLDEDEESDGGTGELEGHSAGRIMLAGIRAPTTASLGRRTTRPCQE